MSDQERREVVPQVVVAESLRQAGDLLAELQATVKRRNIQPPGA
jgi:hypothetical protein